MNNYYIISTDLHKIYQNQINKINRSNSNSNTFLFGLELELDLSKLLLEYYSLYNYVYINIEPYEKYFSDKFNLKKGDLTVFDKYNLINIYLKKPSKYLKYDQGIIVFDFSLLMNQEIKSNIIYLMSNYKNLTLNKLYDNYIIHFKEKYISTIDANFNNKLTEIFSNDIQEQINFQRINRLPQLLNNRYMSKKIKDDIDYLNQNRKYTYDKYYCGLNIKHNLNYLNYEKSLMANLKSDDYKVAYVFENDIRNINPQMYQNILDKLKEFNIHIESIINDLHNYADNDIAFDIEVELNQNVNINEFKSLISEIDISDIFDMDKLTNLYQEIKKKTNSNIILNMNDVLDKFVEINVEESNISDLGDSNNFIYNILKFANELIKRKMIKTIKLFNYINNKPNILNNMNKS